MKLTPMSKLTLPEQEQMSSRRHRHVRLKTAKTKIFIIIVTETNQ